MSRRRKAVPRFNSLVASATLMSQHPASLRVRANPAEGWWEDAWQFYETNGELRFAIGWISNGLSRLNLQASRRPRLLGDEPTPLLPDAGTGPEADEGGEPSAIEQAAIKLVADIAGGPDGQAQLLARTSTLISIVGLAWVLVEANGDNWNWRVLSNDELRATGTEYEIEDPESDEPGGWRPIAKEHLLIKIWRPHPRHASKPDSSTRGALRPLKQLSLLDDHIEATAQSRLAGAGLLAIPNELTFQPIEHAEPDEPPTEDDFVDVLIDSMTMPIADRGVASSVVPLTIRVPGEYADKLSHLTFWTEFSEVVLALGERAIKRLALALDMPPEIVTGVSGMNHWGAWRIQEEAITLHIEPLAQIICHALTVNYLRPSLIAMDFDEAEVAEFQISADSTNLTVRPDKSDDAIAAWDRLEVSGKTLRREIGLSESDKPDEEELRTRIILRAIDRAPQLAAALMKEYGIDVPDVYNQQTYPAMATETTPDEQIGGAPRRHRRRRSVSASAAYDDDGLEADSRLSDPALVAACDGLVHRALERAGAKLRNKAGRKVSAGGAAAIECDDVAELHTQIDVSAHATVHELLDGAWARVDEVADRYSVPADDLRTVVDSYTRGLLVSGQTHSINKLEAALSLSATA